MITYIDILFATIAGTIFTFVYSNLKKLNKRELYFMVFTASLLDWEPVYTGRMVGSITGIVILHVIFVAIAYIELVLWVFTDDDKLYSFFFAFWIIAYMLGWISFLGSIV